MNDDSNHERITQCMGMRTRTQNFSWFMHFCLCIGLYIRMQASKGNVDSWYTCVFWVKKREHIISLIQTILLLCESPVNLAVYTEYRSDRVFVSIVFFLYVSYVNVIVRYCTKIAWFSENISSFFLFFFFLSSLSSLLVFR